MLIIEQNRQQLYEQQLRQQMKMIQNQQQAGPVDQVTAGLLNGVGSQPLAGVQLDPQSQLLQCQQQLLQQQIQQLNNEDAAMKLLQQNFMQARISPSMAADQQLLQNKVFLEQNLKQQVMMEQNLINQQMLEQSVQGQVLMEKQVQQNLLEQVPSQTQWQPNLLNQQLTAEINTQNQVLQQQIIQQQQTIIAQQAAAIQQKQFEEQLTAQDNMIAGPQNLVTGQMLDPSLQNLQTILSQIIQRPDTLQSRKESESETQQQQQQQQQMTQQPTENVDMQQNQEQEALLQMQNLVNSQLQQQNVNYQHGQQFSQPSQQPNIDPTYLAQHQQVAQAQQQVAQAQQQLDVQKQVLAQQQLALQQHLQQAPHHARALQPQQHYLAQQALQLHARQDALAHDWATLLQRRTLLEQLDQRSCRRQDSEPDPYPRPQLQQQLSVDRMQGQSMPHHNFGMVRQNERQISSHEGTPVQNYSANPLQMYQPAQSQPVMMQNMYQTNQMESSIPSSAAAGMQSVQDAMPQQMPVQVPMSVPQPMHSVPLPIQQSQVPQQQQLQPIQQVQTIQPQIQQMSQPVPQSQPQPTPVPHAQPLQQQVQLQPDLVQQPQQLNLPADQVENGYQSNGGQKEQFHTPLTEFPTNHAEAIKQPELSSVEEKQAEIQQQEVGTAISSPITSEKKSRGSKKRSREKDKLPKLTVLEVNEAATMVECQLESKSKTVTFKFDVTDVNPEEIASNLVSNNLLPEWQSATFMELIKDIVNQLITNPGVTPVLNPAHHSALRLNIDKTDYDSETTEREENLTDSNQDNSECTTPTASHDNIAAELAYDQPESELGTAPAQPGPTPAQPGPAPAQPGPAPAQSGPAPALPHAPHGDTVARKISTASSIGSNQSDGGSMAPERSGSTESQSGEKKQQKPTRKISRFLVSPVVDRGENVPEEKPIPEPAEHVEPQVNGLPEKEPAPLPPQEFVPTHQYSVAPQIQPPVDLRPDVQSIERPIEMKQEVPVTVTMVLPPIVSNISSVPQVPAQNIINPMLNSSNVQPNLTTPLQIATDTPLLGLSQVGTPMGVGGELGLNMGLQGVGLAMSGPTPGANDAMPNAENIQRMLLKQNIMNQQQNLSGPNLLGLLNQQSYPQPDIGLHNNILNNTQPAPMMAARLPPQYQQPKYYQPMLANDFIAQQQALQSSVNQLASQQMSQLGMMGLATPLAPQAIAFQHQNIAQNLALNQNLMGQNLGQNLGNYTGLAGQNLGLGGQNLIGGQNLALGGQNLSLGGQNLGIINQNLGQLVAQRAVHHALARRAVDMDMAGMTAVNSTGSSQPSTPNKPQSYSEYMLTLQHKLASISNSGPVSPQSPLEYSPALSPTHRPALHAMPKSEGAEAGEASEASEAGEAGEASEAGGAASAAARGTRHAAQLAELDHELSKISLHYKHPPPKDVFIEHNTDEHEMLTANINDSAVNTYEELGPEWESRSTRFRVSRAAPCRGYELCRLLPNDHGKEKLDLLQSHPYPEGALDEVSCADNNSSYEEATAGETYVITDTRAHTYLVHDALADAVATIIDPGRTSHESSPGLCSPEERRCASDGSQGSSASEQAYLIVDPWRSITCAVIDRALRLTADSGFTPFYEAKYAADVSTNIECVQAGTQVSARAELARWQVLGAAGEAVLAAPSQAVLAAPGQAVLAAPGQAVSTAPEPASCAAPLPALAASLVTYETLTDKAVCRQVVLVSVQPSQL
ncbi:unnamed protein product [Spodoptera littoralis]|uniref:Serine/threonine-protein kinase WNK CCTL2 domain-containing protein n=1 Tax=Spodoptera littoralis TaxID=7109 RepID=A0A9P0N660_SPOLI|nr:unnamed protein product [Spodoptera littoralis]CAH1643863.1 unnamed protein product [Spodoptera littoralis]